MTVRMSRCEDCVTESFAAIDVVFNIRNGTVRSLNRTASAIWRASDGSVTLTELIDRLRGLPLQLPESAYAEIPKFVDELQQWGMLRMVEE